MRLFFPPRQGEQLHFFDIRRHEEGFIITLMWHAVPPNMDEPVAFRKAIQSDLTDEEWKYLVTPGTLMNERWS